MERGYKRGFEEADVPDGWVQRGETLGGGEIMAPRVDEFPVVLLVRSGDEVWGYGLIGDPRRLVGPVGCGSGGLTRLLA